jgi:hypothetical protein
MELKLKDNNLTLGDISLAIAYFTNKLKLKDNNLTLGDTSLAIVYFQHYVGLQRSLQCPLAVTGCWVVCRVVD